MTKEKSKVLLHDFLIDSDVATNENAVMQQERHEPLNRQRTAPMKKHISTKVVTTSNIITNILKE